ncbi:unnamed protein product [Calypogeia fissa]
MAFHLLQGRDCGRGAFRRSALMTICGSVALWVPRPPSARCPRARWAGGQFLETCPQTLIRSLSFFSQPVCPLPPGKWSGVSGEISQWGPAAPHLPSWPEAGRAGSLFLVENPPHGFSASRRHHLPVGPRAPRAGCQFSSGISLRILRLPAALGFHGQAVSFSVEDHSAAYDCPLPPPFTGRRSDYFSQSTAVAP